MVIVTDFGCLVHEYIERCSGLVFPRPNECPHCRVVDTLIGHGFYERKALSQTAAYVLPRSPTVAILAWVEKVYTVAAGTVLGLLLCEIISNMVKYVRALFEA